jgi:hypothetical protein
MWTPKGATPAFCEAANKPDSYCNWQTCEEWDNCTAKCASVGADHFCGYCNGPDCTSFLGETNATCSNKTGCLLSNGTVILLSPVCS